MSTRLLLTVTLCAALAALIGCGSSEEDLAVDTAAIQELLEGYAPRLAEAYATEDPQKAAGFAAGREIAAIEKRIGDYRDAGYRLEPTFKGLSVEDVKIWSYSNAYVTTNEIWDLRLYAYGTEELSREELDQRNRVRYQLKRDGDEWRVLFRTVQE